MNVTSELNNESSVTAIECATIGTARYPIRSNADVDLRSKFNGVRAADLLNQQMWCWGQDIEFPGGNLLVRRGLQRIESEPGSRVASIYRQDVTSTARIVLRGFGVFYGDDRWGGLFLRRYGFSPQLTPAPDLPRPAWTVDDLPQLIEPGDSDFARSQRLLLELMEWIRRYEVWIVETIGVEYRRSSLAPWISKEHVVTRAEEMASAWRLLGMAIADDSRAGMARCRAPRSRHCA